MDSGQPLRSLSSEDLAAYRSTQSWGGPSPLLSRHAAREGLSGSPRLPTTPPSLNIAFSFLLFKSFDIFQSKIFLSMNLGKGRGLFSAEYCFPSRRWAALCPPASRVLSLQHPESLALSTQGPQPSAPRVPRVSTPVAPRIFSSLRVEVVDDTSFWKCGKRDSKNALQGGAWLVVALGM